MRIYRNILMPASACIIAFSVSGQTVTPPESKIAISISVAKKTLPVGKTLHAVLRISNLGKAPTLIANHISTAESSNCGEVAHLVVSIHDAHGRPSPAMRMIADCFPDRQPSDDKASAKLLASWALLYPQTSMLFEIPVDPQTFAFLYRPGIYSLSAVYSSQSVLTGGENFGLSKELLNSLPFASWSGKIHTNTVSFTVASAAKRAP